MLTMATNLLDLKVAALHSSPLYHTHYKLACQWRKYPQFPWTDDNPCKTECDITKATVRGRGVGGETMSEWNRGI